MPVTSSPVEATVLAVTKAEEEEDDANKIKTE